MTDNTMDTTDSLKEVLSKLDQILEENKNLNTRSDELGFDINNVKKRIDNMSIKLDVLLNANIDPTGLRHTNRKNTILKRRYPIVTAFWKDYYRDITSKFKSDDDFKESKLAELGLKSEIIDYVRKNKPNVKKNKDAKLEAEGGHIWKELQDRYCRHPDDSNPATRIIENIRNLHMKFKKDMDKSEAIPLTPEIPNISLIMSQQVHRTKSPCNSSNSAGQSHELYKSETDDAQGIKENNDENINNINTDDF